MILVVVRAGHLQSSRMMFAFGLRDVQRKHAYCSSQGGLTWRSMVEELLEKVISGHVLISGEACEASLF